MTMPIAAVVLVIVLVVGGVGAYFGLAAINPKSTTTCAPTNSAVCGALTTKNIHDLTLFVPYAVSQTGTLLPFTASLPVGESASQYNFTFGDGQHALSGSNTATHVFNNPGTFIASVQALVNGVWHDSYAGGLEIISVSASAALPSSANAPSVHGVVTSNATGGAPVTGARAILGQGGGQVWVTGTYTGSPTNPVYQPQAPTIITSVGTISNAANTSTSASAAVTFATVGTHWITFVAKAVTAAGVVGYQNFTWTVFVGTPGYSTQTSQPASPHKNTLNAYEFTGSPLSSLDPAIAYDTVSAEPIENIFQTLITYNQSLTGVTASSYVPVIATCVPGSAQCQTLYGSTLTDFRNYTFVIDSAPQFYDPQTGNHWGVYPTDVLFSIIRTESFAIQPCVECNNGWIISQSLLPFGNASWDGGIHALNNTPAHMYGTITLNDTAAGCTATIQAASHGCVTFDAFADTVPGAPSSTTGAPHLWPFFLELITDNLGASIVPCGWFSAPAQSAGIPYWTAGNVSGNGDHPCAAPGSAGYGVNPLTLPAKALDAYQTAGSGTTGSFLGNVQFNAAGSGPYYLPTGGLVMPTSYALRANPFYASNAKCTWAGCYPVLGKFAANVNVVWETSEVPGEQAYQAGVADFAGIPATQAAFLLQLVQQGKIGVSAFPSISVFFWPFNLNYSVAKVGRFTTSPINIPADFFANVGLRQLWVHAFPYSTIQSTISTKDGIQYFFNYGGAIPQFMANYYPTNISFPSTDPCSDNTNPACPAYWWTQITTAGSAYYDPEAAACKVTTCKVVTFGQLAAPDLDQRFALINAQISAITGGAIQVSTTDLSFATLVAQSLFQGPHNSPLTNYQLGWAPDYPDPTDYVGPLYGVDATYTAGDTVAEQLALPAYNAVSCASGTTQPGYYVSNPVINACQGQAFKALTLLLAQAAVASPSGTQRVLLYNMAEQIANKLALYVYWGQQNVVATYAAWIDGTTINSNVTIGGGGDILWFSIGGNGVHN